MRVKGFPEGPTARPDRFLPVARPLIVQSDTTQEKQSCDYALPVFLMPSVRGRRKGRSNFSVAELMAFADVPEGTAAHFISAAPMSILRFINSKGGGRMFRAVRHGFLTAW
jgi:hypothetical protein